MGSFQILLASMLTASLAFAAVPVDSKAFFTSIQGKYTIQKAGGKPPHTDSPKTSTVDADKDEAFLTMPFCIENEACDPGYVELAYSKTTVTAETLSDGTKKNTITFTDGKDKRTYYWMQTGKNYKFVNPQYSFNGRPKVTLEHELVKAAK